MVAYRSGDALWRCLESLTNRDDVGTRLIVVDNDSSDQVALRLARQYPVARAIDPGRNVGFAAAANLGLSVAKGEWLAIVNPDTIVPAGVLGALVGMLRSQPTVAAVAPRLDRPDGRYQPFSHGAEPTPWYVMRRQLAHQLRQSMHDWGPGQPRAVDWVSGACLVLRRSALDEVGRFDERFFLYFEDVDWCRRCRAAGWRIWLAPDLSVIHDSHAEYADRARRGLYQTSLLAYYEKYYGPIFPRILHWLLQSLPPG